MTKLMRNQLSTEKNELEQRRMLITVTVSPGEDVLQDAIDQAAASGGGTVLLNDGVYEESNSIILKSDVFIIGKGNKAADTVIKWKNEIGSLYDKPLMKNDGDVNNIVIKNVKLRGLRDDHDDPNDAETPSQHGVLITGDGDPVAGESVDNKDIALVDVEVRNFGGHGIHIKGTDNVHLKRIYAHKNGWAPNDLFHNVYLRRVRDAIIEGSAFKKSVSGHGLRIADTKNAYVGSSQIKENADHGLHASDGTNVFLDVNMKPDDGNNWQSSNNGKNPSGGWRNYGWYTDASYTWVEESPVHFG